MASVLVLLVEDTEEQAVLESGPKLRVLVREYLLPVDGVESTEEDAA
jgi:hypothetical protein